MSGVSVDIPDPEAQASSQDLAAAMTGGDNFLARVKVISELRENAKKRAASIVADAEKQMEQASQARQEAADELSKAKATAQGLVAKARQEASKVVAEAQNYHKVAREQANGFTDKASQEAGAIRSEAELLREQAKGKLSELEAKIAEVEQVKADHLLAEDEHKQAAKLKDQHVATYRSMVNTLKDALAKAEDHAKRIA